MIHSSICERAGKSLGKRRQEGGKGMTQRLKPLCWKECTGDRHGLPVPFDGIQCSSKMLEFITRTCQFRN